MTTVVVKGPLVLTMLVFGIACGGVVVVDNGDEDDGHMDGGSSLNGNGNGDPSDNDHDGTTSEEGWTTSHSAQCVDDCGSWIKQCDDDKICVEPNATCPGPGAERVQELVACVCAGCAERCGGSCVMFDTANPECLECQQTMVRQTCSYEYYECVGL